ncbi:hypothetical protein T492DRAFT_1102040 [Pavlovales sp. CCMP2436]|nr:hypothetical protein T492DRAFT_1102040 [Pavlovales sp. CCMP2436]
MEAAEPPRASWWRDVILLLEGLDDDIQASQPASPPFAVPSPPAWAEPPGAALERARRRSRERGAFYSAAAYQVGGRGSSELGAYDEGPRRAQAPPRRSAYSTCYASSSAQRSRLPARPRSAPHLRPLSGGEQTSNLAWPSRGHPRRRLAAPALEVGSSCCPSEATAFASSITVRPLLTAAAPTARPSDLRGLDEPADLKAQIRKLAASLTARSRMVDALRSQLAERDAWLAAHAKRQKQQEVQLGLVQALEAKLEAKDAALAEADAKLQAFEQGTGKALAVERAVSVRHVRGLQSQLSRLKAEISNLSRTEQERRWRAEHLRATDLARALEQVKLALRIAELKLERRPPRNAAEPAAGPCVVASAASAVQRAAQPALSAQLRAQAQVAALEVRQTWILLPAQPLSSGSR